MALRINKAEDRFIVKFRYSSTIVKKIKSISGKWWHPDEQYWSLPVTQKVIEQLIKVFAGTEVILDQKTRNLFYDDRRHELTNLKHRAILFLTYSAGLRVSEVVRLRIEDIDTQRILVYIRESKGEKDRYSLLSRVALEELKKYTHNNKLDKWLFPGAQKGKHLFVRSSSENFQESL